MTSRRKFLQSSAQTGFAAATLAAFPPSIRAALAIAANNRTGTIRDVEHVVILMQENRSFDHYFGGLRGARGFGDRFTIPLPGGRNVFEQLDANGNVLMPYHLNSETGNRQRFPGTPHSWADGQAAWDGGRMDQWPRYKTAASMGRNREAFYDALAKSFTLCDAYHCSMLTGTNSNRMFLWTGTNGPTAAGVATVNNEWDTIGPSTEGYRWKTFPERLQEGGISWIVYQWMPDNFGDNPLAGFVQYRKANELSGKPVSNQDGVRSQAYDPASDDPGNPLYKGIANTMPDGGFLQQFRQDIQAGKLPQVSWIVAPSVYSDHPGPSSPVQGAWYVQKTLDALTAVPEVFSKTVLFVTYDENDGYFDHMPPPAAPSINPDGTLAGKTTLSDKDLAFEYFVHPSPPGSTQQPPPDGRVYGPGMRVPMFVISPWSRGGFIASEVFDHTSVIRFLEKRFGVREPNISAYRRAFCGDLTSAFNFGNPNEVGILPFPPLEFYRKTRPEADAVRAEQEKLPPILPPAEPGIPLGQDTGIRPARGLPYELFASAVANIHYGKIRLMFVNTGQAGAVFHVYDKLHLDRLPRRYAVEAGKRLYDDWNPVQDDAGLYDLFVLGPNGFHRSFKGDMSRLRPGGAPQPDIRVLYNLQTAGVYLVLRNDGTRTCVFTITTKAYGFEGPVNVPVKGGEQVEYRWQFGGPGGWYDYEVSCDSDAVFRRRLAGHTELWVRSVTDPAFTLPP